MALALALTLACLPGGADAQGVSFRLDPPLVEVEPGQEFTVELAVDAGSDFNGYDLYLAYDPAALTLLLGTQAEQEGELFPAACPNRYHRVELAPDSTQLWVSHVLLCTGASVQGPGVLYRLRFAAGALELSTTLVLEATTTAYQAGEEVTPISRQDALVQVGDPTGNPPAAERLRLGAAPNPFNPRTRLRWSQPGAGPVELWLYGSDGRRVASLAAGWWPAGEHELHFDGRDDRGRPLASGVYRARLRHGGDAVVLPLTLVR